MTDLVRIDTHCHLDWFDEKGTLGRVIGDSRREGVSAWIVPGVSPVHWGRIEAVTRWIEGAYPAYGLHPLHAAEWDDERACELQRRIRDAVAVGEIGLDHSDGYPEREAQKRAFRDQLELAASAGKPVILHCRRAFGDVLSILDGVARGGIAGVIHAFSGSPETALEFVRRGFFIGVAGSITFEGARRLPETVARIGLSRLVVETDSPDLSPLPKRGEINTPANLPLIAEAVSRHTGAPPERVWEQTSVNARQLFRLP